MRRAYKHLVLFALVTLFAGLGMTASQTDPGLAQKAARPNIVFILTDDMNATDLNYMPNTQSLLANNGVKFENAFVTRSLCCPSRATILRSQYTHNHNVWTNVNPSGGFWNFFDQGLENSTIATWLDDPNNFSDGVDYDTILIGKYLNRYGLDRNGNYSPTTYIPPGWDKWYAWEGTYSGTDTSYQINQNGKIVTYQRSQIHDTDLHAQTAVNFIKDPTRNKSTPFFMYLAPDAPHKPAYYAKRHANMFKGLALPTKTKPSFNEADVSDKPKWVQNKPRLSSTKISNLTTLYRKRLRALQSVDEMVKNLVDTLSVKDPVTGKAPIDNTYIVFTSDNGDYFGEHRLEEKAGAYEESPRVPLLVRGPGVPQGVVRSEFALNNDFAPTFASWASVTPPSFVDGRSLAPLLSSSPPATWRSAFLIEHRSAPEEFDYVRAIPEYNAVRTSQFIYVEYPTTGEHEFYDLDPTSPTYDPYQLTNTYNAVVNKNPQLISDLQAKLDALKLCKGTGPTAPSCEAAEGM
jgi:N-acetylglucosamine-6-sulfatase